MDRITILCVEDEPEVRDAVERDLEPFMDAFRVEMAEDVADAEEVLKELEHDCDMLGLALCDHVMPGKTGVEFLVELHHRSGFERARKVLITGQAMHEDTIKAVNDANLDHYISKPWTRESLHDVVREQLTNFVLTEGVDPLPYVQILDGARLMEAVSKNAADK